MAAGEIASSVGFPLVPDNGENGKVKYGAREINVTRDLIATLQKRLPGRITVSATAPTSPVAGDVWIKVV